MPFENPFTPSFGEIPLHMAGREAILRETMTALERTSRSPELCSLISGARGTGKTALLSLIAEESQKRGWISVNVACFPGMLRDIYEQTLLAADHLLEKDSRLRVTGFGLGDFLSVELDSNEAPKGNWRTKMTRILDRLQEVNIGLLITVDEVDPTLQEMIELAGVYQMFVRERRKVALFMAGLPHKVSKLIQDKSVSFLRRGKRRRLEKIPEPQVSLALARTIEDGGKSISNEALAQAAASVQGFAFMLQLVGYYLWEASGERSEILPENVSKGILVAQQEMDNSVLEPTYAGLSEGDLAFCRAMLESEGECAISDVAARIGKGTSTVNTYRARLIEQGVIGSPRRGTVQFELPFFREYLQSREGMR